MKHVFTKTIYLEMLGPLALVLPPPLAGTRVERLRTPTVDTYRALYNSVGRAFHWTDRNLMPDEELLHIIQNVSVEIDVLYVDDEPAGYVELDRRIAGEIQIAYFGLFPAFIGKGLGKYFLSCALDRAWSFRPRRVWVHTCELDHPAALPNYLRAGFSIYDEKLEEQTLTDQ
jgi:GNAT superfamily N-acetyltransferase